MIVRPEDGELVLVTQPDHASLAADLLSRWCLDGLAAHPRSEELLLACREHDNGWRETDSAPRRDEAGRPVDFLRLPAEQRIELWRRGTGRYRARRPYVALILTQHALALHEPMRGHYAYDAFLADMAELRAELLGECDLDLVDLVADYRWIQLADALSLTVCLRRPEIRVGSVSARVQGGVLGLDPFPYDGPAVVRLSYRRIPDRRYRSDADLGSELALARWRTDEVAVIPFEGAA